jgi:hypothetical protein
MGGGQLKGLIALKALPFFCCKQKSKQKGKVRNKFQKKKGYKKQKTKFREIFE